MITTNTNTNNIINITINIFIIAKIINIISNKDMTTNMPTESIVNITNIKISTTIAITNIIDTPPSNIAKNTIINMITPR